MVSDLPAWLSVLPTGGETLSGGESPLSVTVRRQGLDPGTYRHVVSITSNAGVGRVEVSMVVPAAEFLPDLIITDLWDEDGTVCYQLRNIGNAVAAEGHTTGLFVNRRYAAADIVPVALGPGERWNGCFQYLWTCDGLEDVVRGQVDWEGDLAESDGTNNSREEIWRCDTVAPTITAGPTVQQVTQDSVTIVWETDEDSDSTVRYGKVSGRYDRQAGDADPASLHSATLVGLEPSTTYRFVVQSSDASGNTVTSRDATFQTLAPRDERNPSVSANVPVSWEGLILLSADASDDTSVEKVEYLLDGELLFTDYSPPYEFSLDTTKHSNGEHTLTVRATDSAGKTSSADYRSGIANPVDETAPSVIITSPKKDDIVSGKATVSASLSDDTGLSVFYLRVDGQFEYFQGFGGCPKSKTVTCVWDTKTVPNGKHRLAAEVYDRDGKYALATCDVFVSQAPPALPPKLKIRSHDVTRNGHYFTISLTIENVGDSVATNIVIGDGLKRFQPISGSDGVGTYEASFVPSTLYAQCAITSSMVIHAKQWQTYTYNAVPVLIEHPQYPQYIPPPASCVGDPVQVWYSDQSAVEHYEEFHLPVLKTTGGETIENALTNALHSADYLIVTNPQRLFWYNASAPTEVDKLLSSMAELALLKNGALGYLYSYDVTVLCFLTQQAPGLLFNRWSNSLKSDWTSNGYLLIVGETEIVPAWVKVVGTGNPGGGPDYTWKPITDYPYASTYDDYIVPELSIGRIIGNNAKELRKVIETSLNVTKGTFGYGFDRSHSLLLSGFAAGMDGKLGYLDFKDQVATVLKEITKKVPSGFHATLNGPDFTQYDPKTGLINTDYTDKVIEAAFYGAAFNQDLIFMAGHGNWAECDAIDIWSLGARVNPFGFANPVVFASSCKTGIYTQTPGSGSLAEAFLQKGAAIYLGATEAAGWTAYSSCFFQKWDIGDSVALAVKETKRSLGDELYDKVWSACYHVFGDAKFGSVGATTFSAALSPEQPLDSIDLVVPDYEVTYGEQADSVEIPGGNYYVVPDMPLLPCYRAFYTYPKGCQIQDVVLTYRSEAVVATGLSIPPLVIQLPSVNGSRALNASGNPEWWPDRIFEWKVLDSPDSCTLRITVFPFYYNSLTTDARFHKTYSFDVDYIVLDVEITNVGTDKHEYAPGEPVVVSMELENKGGERDFVLSAAVKSETSGEVVSGLLLRTLKGLKGKASFCSEWDSSGFECGHYTIEVELNDTEGRLLDKAMETCRLGLVAGEVKRLVATPECLDPGTTRIDVNMAFANTGTINIDGNAIIRAFDSAGNLVLDSEHSLVGLAPSDLATFQEALNVSGEQSFYTVVGYVLYEGQSSEPAIVKVYRRPSAPTGLAAEMLLAGHLSWSPSPEPGVVGYRIYRTKDGGPWEEIAFTDDTSYADRSVVRGSLYAYKVAAVNETGVEGPLSEPTGEMTLVMQVREAEDFDYGGGQWPGRQNCPAANEAPSADALNLAYDYYYAAHFTPDDWRRSYRPNDDVGMHGYPVEDPTAVDLDPTVISWVTGGDWWRYTFSVERAGWVKLVLRLASRQEAVVAHLFWDEGPVGTIEVGTGSHHEYRDYPITAFPSAAGQHTLRVAVDEGEAEDALSFDKIGIGYGWSPPRPQAAISKLGDAISLSWQPFGSGLYVVQYTDDLVGGAWQNAGEPTAQTTWPVESSPGTRRRFYRVGSQ